MRVRVPATSANIGPGFDTLALAVGLHTEVLVEPAVRLSIEARGTAIAYPIGDDHLAAKVARSVLGHDRVRIEITSTIPPAGGLGSSAALAVGVAAAAGCDDPLALVARLEGHADNAAACVMGGLVTAAVVDGTVRARRLPLDPDVAVVALVPSKPLRTSEARRVLPATLPHADAAANLGRLAALLAGLADLTQLEPWMGEDRLAMPYREPLLPSATRLLAALVDAGAQLACWSGAGPTLIGICSRALAPSLCAAGASAMEAGGVVGDAMVLDVDHDGLVVVDR